MRLLPVPLKSVPGKLPPANSSCFPYSRFKPLSITAAPSAWSVSLNYRVIVIGPNVSLVEPRPMTEIVPPVSVIFSASGRRSLLLPERLLSSSYAPLGSP